MGWTRKDILHMEDLKPSEIQIIINTAKPMKEILSRAVKKLPTFRGRSVYNLFFESSTRTRTSFETAAKILGADTTSLAVAQSSVNKGESLLDTVRTLQAMKPDLVVIRHSSSGAAHFLAKELKAGVINAGDGQHEHPTQALLDLYTMQEHLGSVEGKKILLVGDILHSRVARSNVWALKALGAEVVLVGPPTLLTPEIKSWGVKTTYHLDEELAGADVIMALRLQLERQKAGLLPSLREYSQLYGITAERVQRTGKKTLIMHPGPVNRGVEIESSIVNSTQSVIEEQVTNGVAVRMAIMYLLLGGGTNHVVD
ncbi:aspartate carbamoyltransferase [Desulfitobacterium dichloroeliminans LMG P-21439]|uniref:Aspartate carbamoyltransferase n=1 Tax=Desulfitobacterium dichloroeliminans (strain LMG P-21439 / DCA1) TaxID=871963 RepID=L0FAE4_DESDL|nr:aspartate carbamoyltransferase catalytic subunit [Desulfitobacterium dichloroeliminans]AGA70182.1 aspartate carbamoyltransferase [Desulfitobacterium dichloroeliminans LMG P-21439]